MFGFWANVKMFVTQSIMTVMGWFTGLGNVFFAGIGDKVGGIFN